MSSNGDPKHDALNRALIALQNAEYELEKAAREMASLGAERAKIYDGELRQTIIRWWRDLDPEINP